MISIIGILLALLLPAVQAAREAARRNQCANNLKQLALASLQYESTYKMLPPSGLAATTDDPHFKEFSVKIFNPAGGLQLSWIVLLLPYLEESALYDRFDLTPSNMGHANQPREVTVQSLVVPQRPGVRPVLYDV